MEENVIKIDINNYVVEVLGCKYGSTLVQYDYELTRKLVGKLLLAINTFAGDEVLREDPHTDGWENETVEGVYRLVYTDRINPMPELSEGDITVFDDIEESIEEESLINVSISPQMVNAVRKRCKKANIKCYEVRPGIIALDGRKKAMSVYKQIQQAYNDGLNSISFDLREINMPTVRTYASQFGSAVMQKIRCSTDNGMITVHFKDDEIANFKIALLAAKSGLSELQISQCIKDIFPEHEFISLEKINSESYTEPGVDELPEGVEIVDGMPQYVIYQFKQDENKMDEDEDF